MVARDGPSAIGLMQTFHPDVALLDIGLPGMDGYELARRLTALPPPRHVRLIALTGYGEEQDRARSFAAGFEAYLLKPIDLERLRNILDQPSR
jgi:CheY-like chemotaxis protein